MQLSKTLFILTVGIFLSLGLMLFDSLGKLSWARGGIETLFGPELKSVRFISGKYNLLENTAKSILGKNSESKNLTDKLSILEANSLEAEKLRRENEDLRQILGAEKISGLKLEPAEVLAFNNQSLITGKGPAAAGQAVVDSRMALVGVLENSGQWHSSVKLLADPSSRISVNVIPEGQDSVSGEIAGEFGGRIALEKILTSVDLKDGQPVFTSGTDNLPPGLLVGWVSGEIHKTESAVFQKAYIRPAAQFPDLKTIFFVINE